ncbi:malonyl-ACP O-methyltransferase BioC [uncultured Ilyobacter sp.]|uniref:malonyl-ACP O-methyltransferase BioC n=1 Tax=uncultured Ilyobacter sp. TaxID=544433 RepID=UPI0029C7B0F2|nr:malonyl-ACP O-methyltransferase BioC [uncultured Ilyobacter sp.]
MIDKKKVNRNFSKGAKTYDEYALIQRHMADKLGIFIEDSEEIFNILEIGCGTGIFSEKILDKFPNSNIDFLDISPEMIKNIKDKLGSREKLNYIVEDIENYKPEKKYDLIFSNATFQWIQNKKELFGHLDSLINYGGLILFSTFGKDTYCELRESLKAIDSSLEYSQNFISLEELKGILGDRYKILAAEEERVKEEYTCVMDFLKMIKGIGANSALSQSKPFTRDKFNRLDEEYRKKYCSGDSIEVTNHLIYMILGKSY